MSCIRGSPSGIVHGRAGAGADTIALRFVPRLRDPSEMPAHLKSSSLRFLAVIRMRGINPYVHVSASRANQLRKDWRKPMPVLTRVNGEPAAKPWRINMMPAGDGSFY